MNAMKKTELRAAARFISLVALLAFSRAGDAAQVTLDLRAGTQPRLMASKSSTDAVAVVSGLVRYHRLAAGTAKVSALALGDWLCLQLFDDKTLTVELVKETPSRFARAFLGKTAEGPGDLDCVVLETEQGLIVDVADSANGRVWQVVSGAEGVQVREAQPKGVVCPSKPIYPQRPGSPVPTISIGGATNVVSASVLTSELPAIAASVCGGPATATIEPPVALADKSKAAIDILVAYDTRAAKWAKENGGGLNAFAEKSVNKMNLAIANTELDEKFQFRLVGVYEIGASAGSDFEYALKCGSGESRSSTDKAAWSKVAAVREQYSADIVTILIDTGKTDGTTGLGYSLVKGSVDPASCGYNVCAVRSVSSEHTMAHEVGHNMGAGHSDRMADKSNCGPQYHDYSRGYYFSAGGKKYYTIMAYNDDGYGNHYDPVPYFSSPAYQYAGVSVGDAKHDNTKTLSELYATIAANRNPPEASAAIGVGLDAEQYTWTTDGTYPWTKEEDWSSFSDGVVICCASSLKTTTSGTSWTETRVVGPATLTFSYKLVSIGGQFLVTCDGKALFAVGGAGEDHQMHTWQASPGLSIPAGEHVVRFSHANNGYMYYPPANAVWVDRVVFAGGHPPGGEPEPILYTIAFDANGGTVGVSSRQVADGDEIGGLPAATRVGYDFYGWYTKAVGGSKADGSEMAAADMTLYAHWKAISYPVTYELDGGDNAASNPTNYTVESGRIVLAEPTRDGYVFKGWTPDGGVIAKGSTGPRSFTATWEEVVAVRHEVVFDANGGTVADPPRTVVEGEPVGALSEPTRVGYEFLGWFTLAKDGEPVTAETVVTGDMTVYAQWRQLKYRVDLDGVVSDGYVYGQEVTVSTFADMTNGFTNVVCVGWVGTGDVPPTGVGSSVTFAVTQPSSLKWLYATNYWVNATAGEGGTVLVRDAADAVTANEAWVPDGTLLTLEAMADEGCAFVRWTDMETGDACGVSATLALTVSEPQFVQAEFEEEYVEPEIPKLALVAGGKVALDVGLVGYAVTGLPAGLKYDAKTGTVAGACKVAGTYAVTFSRQGEDDVTVAFEVVALPAWAMGTFDGRLDDGSGAVKMAVGTGGKVSGKFVSDGKTWSFAATTLEPTGDAFVVEATAKAGKETRSVRILIGENGASGSLFAADELVANLTLWRNAWKDARATARLVPYVGLYTVQLVGDESGYGYLSLTLDAKGNCKASGRLPDGTAVSASLPLVWDEEAGAPFAVWQVAPGAYKGGCVGGLLRWADDRSVSAENVLWTSRAPTATGEFGAGFERTMSVGGARYDKGENLRRLYEAPLSFVADSPTLDAQSEQVEAAVLACWGNLTISPDTRGAAFVVDQGKPTKPVLDKVTNEWSYEGDNDAALSMSFAKATGVFKGSFTSWFDFTDQKGRRTHVSRKAGFEGIMVRGEPLRGLYLWERQATYRDAKSGEGKTYKYRESRPVAFE